MRKPRLKARASGTTPTLILIALIKRGSVSRYLCEKAKNTGRHQRLHTNPIWIIQLRGSGILETKDLACHTSVDFDLWGHRCSRVRLPGPNIQQLRKSQAFHDRLDPKHDVHFW